MGIRRLPLARHAGWLLLGLYAILAGVGLSLAFANHAAWARGAPPTPDRLVTALALGLWGLVGALLISRRPQNPIGWLFSIAPVLLALDEFAFGYAYYGIIAHPGALPAVGALMSFLYVSGHVLFLLPVSFLLLLFPNGRALSPGWGKWIRINTGFMAVYFFTAAIHPISINPIPFPLDLVSARLGLTETALAFKNGVTWLAYFGALFSVIVSIVSLLVRLTRARGVERQQLKWFVYSAAFAAPGFTLLVVGLILRPTMGNLVFDIGNFFLTLFFIPGIPIASAIAILRYRLFDIDIIIRRTLSYALLTGLLVLAYFLVIVTLQWAFGLLMGSGNSPLITVITTLTIAALFNPLRHRIQDFIDRRFYRQKYDAEQALAQFAASARDEVDLDNLTSALLNTVEKTMQPESIVFWLRSEM